MIMLISEYNVKYNFQQFTIAKWIYFALKHESLKFACFAIKIIMLCKIKIKMQVISDQKMTVLSCDFERLVRNKQGLGNADATLTN